VAGQARASRRFAQKNARLWMPPRSNGAWALWLSRYTSAERLVEVKVCRDEQNRTIGVEIKERTGRSAWAQLVYGAYLLRTNCAERDPAKLWKWYIQLQQAEAAFRLSSGSALVYNKD
jgi:hypothetical protein